MKNDGKIDKDKPETLLADSDNWLTELATKSRKLLIKGFSADLQEKKEALIAAQQVVPREKIVIKQRSPLGSRFDLKWGIY